MKKLSSVLFLGIFCLSTAPLPTGEVELSAGEQPQVTVDNKNVIRVVFGQSDKIFCSKSDDNGVTFSNPGLVAEVPKMHLGMSRGPQVATSANYSVITAQDELGSIHWYKLKNTSGEWKSMGILNDLKGSAPEGLMGLAADKKDNFYAVWLDTRAGGGNNIYFSSLANKAVKWSKNRLVYRSPDKLVCGCCKPNIAVNGVKVVIMFRNWLNGSRDLYFLKSLNGGASFAAAEKLGSGTWKLNGCPMDGGGIIIDDKNTIRTTWQRKGMIYYAEPGKPETFISNGRICSISGLAGRTCLAFQDGDSVKIVPLNSNKQTNIGRGSFLRTVMLPGNKTFCVWEKDKKIKFKTI